MVWETGVAEQRHIESTGRQIENFTSTALYKPAQIQIEHQNSDKDFEQPTKGK